MSLRKATEYARLRPIKVIFAYIFGGTLPTGLLSSASPCGQPSGAGGEWWKSYGHKSMLDNCVTRWASLANSGVDGNMLIWP